MATSPDGRPLARSLAPADPVVVNVDRNNAADSISSPGRNPVNLYPIRTEYVLLPDQRSPSYRRQLVPVRQLIPKPRHLIKWSIDLAQSWRR
ncbi:hypothetical protein HDA40_000708 [Hamadaea flava]|nr:hypothetical protein [Hamadaea flava]